MNLSLAQASGLNAAPITFAVYITVVFALAVISNRVQVGKSFLSEYFLGSRSLGMWAFALTLAATSTSGGSFTGFPSLIYTHGWVLALWIASYMLVPVIMMGLLGKRLNQMARQANAITIPDVLRSRFESRPLGILSTVLIIFFMTFNLVAQFKAGAVMLSTLLDDVPLFDRAVTAVGPSLASVPALEGVNPAYLLCLLFFSVAVIVYTSYGGFRAVVWTDVLQGVVMLVGVLILLPLTLSQVGGLAAATKDLARMVPPRRSTVVVPVDALRGDAIELGEWLTGRAAPPSQPRVFRAGERAEATAADDSGELRIAALEIRSPHEVDRIMKRIAAGEIEAKAVVSDVERSRRHAYGSDRPGVYVAAPGPSVTDAAGFLPLAIAVSFFFYWTFSGAGQPSNMVRLMAFNSSATLRRAIVTVAVYFSLIYFPLVAIFCSARVLLPGMEVEADRIMPALAEHVTRAAGAPWLAGLLVAAPFAAVMSTVDSFLLMISSAIVRDVYQRDIAPDAPEKRIKRLTYVVTVLVGIAALLGSVNPPDYLQYIIVFTGGGLSASFLMPVGLALYWPRFNAAGAIAAMSSGFAMHTITYAAGLLVYEDVRPIKLAGLDPFIPELIISLLAGVIVCYSTPRPSASLVERFFTARHGGSQGHSSAGSTDAAG